MPPATPHSRQGSAANGATTSRAAITAALTVLGGAVLWLYLGQIAISPGQPTPEYVFFLPGLRAALLSILLSGCLIAIAARIVPQVSVLTPLFLLAFPVVTVLLTATGARNYVPAWLFLFFDWRWGFLLIIAVLVTRAWLSGLAQQRRQTSPPPPVRRSRSGGIGVVALLAALTLIASPKDRFEGHTDGDEPKYLRFDENWYRGRGLNVADLQDIKELPPGSTPALLKNIPRLFSAVAMLARDFGTEACHAVGRCDAPPRATEAANLFVVGKRGGTYQIHNPGGSLMLLPAYSLDRLLNSTNDYHPHFPTHLYATNIALIVFYLTWSLVLYRWLVRHSGDTVASALVTIVVMTSLPTVAFSYQYYPEVAAGLLVALVTSYLVSSSDARLPAAFAYGFVAGYVPWLHSRFGSVPIAAVAVYAFSRRRQPRATAAFAVGAFVPLAALALYNYHIVGSILPWVMWNLQADSPGFNVTRMTNDLPRFWSDRGAGLLAHAPIYLLALPGLVPLWQKRRDTFITLAAIALPVAAMSAAHSFSAGWTTAGRYIAALAPLLALPMVEAFGRYRRSAWFVAFALLMGLISISNGLLYNANFVRGHNDLHNPTISGWATTLLFTPAVIAGIDAVQLLWWLLTLSLAALPVVFARRECRWQPSLTAAMAVALSAFVLTGSAVGAWSGRTFERKHQSGDPRIEALRAHLARSEGIVWSGWRGLTTAAAVFPSATDPTVTIAPAEAVAGRPFDLNLDVAAPGGALAWGIASVRWGDDNRTERVPVVGRATVRHAFKAPGTYPVFVDVEVGGSTYVRRSVNVSVAAGE